MFFYSGCYLNILLFFNVIMRYVFYIYIYIYIYISILNIIYCYCYYLILVMQRVVEMITKR